MKEGTELEAALLALELDMYVDDLSSGSDTREEREEMILAIQRMLIKGGFSTKYVAKSEEPPCEKASSDGKKIIQKDG